jgi:hypothetical protein
MGQSGDARTVPWWAIALLIISFPLILALVLIVLLLRLATSVCLHAAVWCWWLPRGRQILFVYSESPVWEHHIENEILPFVRSRAVVLNWSQRKHWRFGLAAAAFRHFGGYQEFNPLAVVFQPFRRARVFRFWQPFRDWKHGHGEPLRQMEAELFAVVGVAKNGYTA